MNEAKRSNEIGEQLSMSDVVEVLNKISGGESVDMEQITIFSLWINGGIVYRITNFLNCVVECCSMHDWTIRAK